MIYLSGSPGDNERDCFEAGLTQPELDTRAGKTYKYHNVDNFHFLHVGKNWIAISDRSCATYILGRWKLQLKSKP